MSSPQSEVVKTPSGKKKKKLLVKKKKAPTVSTSQSTKIDPGARSMKNITRTVVDHPGGGEYYVEESDDSQVVPEFTEEGGRQSSSKTYFVSAPSSSEEGEFYEYSPGNRSYGGGIDIVSLGDDALEYTEDLEVNVRILSLNLNSMSKHPLLEYIMLNFECENNPSTYSSMTIHFCSTKHKSQQALCHLIQMFVSNYFVLFSMLVYFGLVYSTVIILFSLR